MAQSDESGPGKPYHPVGGEDESSADHDGADEHLREDQKPLPTTSEPDKDDPHKTEKLTQAGRHIDPNEGAD